MERKVLLTECMNRRVLALLEDEKVTEFHFGSSGEKKSCRLGEIYVGRVRKILPNIGGAFVEIANGEQCYFALDGKYTPVFTNKIGKKPLVIGDELLVQVEKEAVKTKQPVVTGNLNFTGQYVVLTSGNRTIGVSGKIHGARKEELQKLGQDYIDCDFGLIFRTNCVEAEETQIRAEIDKLAENYHRIVEYGKMRTCFSCLQSAPDPCVQALRDIYKKDLTEIIVEETVEDGALYKEVQTYLETEMPEELPLLRAYTDPSYPLVKCYNLEGAIREARQERVWMKSGAYLVIQPTEALTVIDVNSGKCLKKNSHFPEINREAAREAVRQIRLRNISGIIIIDFINMKSAEEKKELLAYLQLELKKDPNPGNVIGMTKLQLVEITRKKIRKTLEEIYMGKKEVKTNAMRILDRKKISYEYQTYECDEFTDGIETADKLNLPHEQVYKTIVTTGKSGEHYVFVLPIEAEIDFKKAAKAVGEKSIEMLHLKELTPLTGYVRGGCTSIGMKKHFPTVIDASAQQFEKVYVSAGRIGAQLTLAPEDLRKAADATFADVIHA